MTATAAVERSRTRLGRALLSLEGISASRIQPRRAMLDMAAASLESFGGGIIRRRADRLDASEKLLEVLSPAATLARGYSITRIDGHAVSSVADVQPGALLEITLSDGSFLAHTP